MTEFIFHIGAHKSASSSFQMAMRKVTANDDAIVYIDHTIDDALQREITHFVDGRRTERAAPELGEQVLQLSKRRKETSSVILSNENYLGKMIGLDWDFYPAAAKIREVIDFVAARQPVRVFLQCRETASLLKSAHSFRIRHGMSLNYEQFLQNCNLEGMSWCRLGRDLFDGAVFEWKVLPLEYLYTQDKHMLVRDSVRFVCPVWDLDSTPIPFTNESPGALSLNTIRVLNILSPDELASKRRRLIPELRKTEESFKGTRLSSHEKVKMLEEALKHSGLNVSEDICREIVHDVFGHKKRGQNLQKLLATFYRDDYQRFHESYVTPAFMKNLKPGRNN